MNRVEVLAKAIHALEAAEHEGVTAVAGRAMAVADAVLTAVADDHAYWAGAVVVDSDYWLGVKHGVEDCATRIRSMTGEQQ